MSLSVDRQSQLLLLCDYLDKAGLSATLSELEAEADVQSKLPGLAIVRRLALDGKWRELEIALKHTEKETAEGEQREIIRKAKYSLAKQQYLEAVARLDAVCHYRDPSTEELEDMHVYLLRLKQLSDSEDDYRSLEALTKSTTDFFDSWNLQKARKETCNDLLACFKCVFSSKRDKEYVEKEESGTQETHPMTVLLAKGKIYEKCEQIFQERCENLEIKEEKKSSTVLDIGSWLYNQPDSIFEDTTLRQMKVVETPLLSNPLQPRAETTLIPTQPNTASPLQPHPISLQQQSTSQQRSASKTEVPSNTVVPHQLFSSKSPETSTPPHKLPAATMTALSTEKGEDEKEREEMKNEAAVNNTASLENGDTKKKDSQRLLSSSHTHRSMEERITEHRDNVEMATNRLRESILKDTTESDEHITSVPQTDPATSYHLDKGQTSSQTVSIHPTPCIATDRQASLNDDHSTQPPSWLLQTTPLLQSLKNKDRNSSTPKPSTKNLISSPATSPVPHISAAGLQQQQGTLSERKQIDFDQEMTCSHRIEEDGTLSISWPSATLIGKVTDEQAVRSVAFSRSGQFVAVGANSKCLRIFSTTPLVDSGSGEEMNALQEYSRYHRGSIYCLAWKDDNLLASGSNDKTIKLLSCHPNSADDTTTITCKPIGRLNFHEGTVRELAFLSNGHLASGGSGSQKLMISDCESLKMIHVLSGHKKQVLAVACGSHGSTIMSGGEDETVRVWDWFTGTCVHTLNLPDIVTSLSSINHHLAVALVDGSCAIYDVRNWRQLSSFQPHSGECRSIRHSPSGRWLLTGSYDSSVCLSDAMGTEWEEVAHHEDKVIQARWHPQGEVFASTSTDNTACFWTIKPGATQS